MVPRQGHWTAPIGGDGVATGDCNDRPNQSQPIRGSINQDYINRCSEPAYHDDSRPPSYYGSPAGHWIRPLCPEPHPVLGGHSICHYCQYNVQKQVWMRIARERWTKPLPGNQQASWNGFWTRLCTDCEIAEQYLMDARNGLLSPVLANAPPAADIAAMTSYPKNTCTCLPWLTNTALCIDHRKNFWEQIQGQANAVAGGTAVPPIVQTRNANRTFLETIALLVPDPIRPRPARVATASPVRQQMRRKHRKWRACRCGKEVNTLAASRLLQCMGCEGVKLIDPDNPAKRVALPPVAAAIHQLNGSNNANFRMQRPYSATEF